MITIKHFPMQNDWHVSMDGHCLSVDGSSPVADRRSFVRLLELSEPTDTSTRWVVPTDLLSVAAFYELKSILGNPGMNPADVEAVYDQLVEDIANHQHARTLAAGSVFS